MALPGGLHNEHTGPSDGALFVASCNATAGIAKRVAAATLFRNHLELAWRTTAMSQVEKWLR